MKRSRFLEDSDILECGSKRLKQDLDSAYLRPLAHRQTRQPGQLQYDRLSSPCQIRLLRVYFNDGRRLCGSFICGNLDSVTVSYCAISYCWGKPEYTGKLWFQDGTYLELTAAAKSILRKRAAAVPNEYVWIDSVCINQADDVEKSQQVQIMQEIYKNAKHVIVWLDWTKYKGWGGQAVKYVDHVSDLLRKTNSTKGSLTVPARNDLLKDNLIRWCEKQGGLNALARLVCEPYFGRSWVLQEVVAAATAEIYCDGVTMRWRDFAQAVILARKYELFRLFRRKRRCRLPEHFPDHVEAVLHIERLRRWRAKGRPLYIQDVLIGGRYANSTKAVDKIYALRGIATDLDPHELVVDYSLPMKTVFTAATRFLYFDKKAYQLLEHAGISNQGVGNDLGSWVIDFRSVAHRDTIIDHGASTAGGQEMPQMQYLEGNRIEVRGHLISTVTSVTGPAEQMTKDQRLVWKAKIRKWYTESSNSGQFKKYHKKLQACANASGAFTTYAVPRFGARKTGSMNESALSTKFENAVRGLRALKSAPTGSVPDTQCLESLADLTSDREAPRSLLMCLSGHVGLGPRTVISDDWLFVIKGCRYPFIIRRNTVSKTARDTDTYTLVGVAYVSGLMNEQGLKMAEPKDIVLS